VTAVDPIAAAAGLSGRRGRVLLHSAAVDGDLGRRSYLACEPEEVLEAHGGVITLRDRTGAVVDRHAGDPLAALEQFIRRHDRGAAAGDAAVPFAIGWLGYDLGRQIERLGPGPPPADTPDLWWGHYPEVEVLEAPAAVRPGPRGVAPLPRLGPLRADQDDDAYARAVDRIRDYITAGDVYQVNLARRLVAPVLAPGDALAIHAAVAARSPASFAALIEGDGATVISASPELFLRRAPGGDRLETRPIKGTRRRDPDPEVDRALAAELAADAKEQAEHLMIVDLERNDLGRVAVTGSVRVDALAVSSPLPTVHHLVSTVSCRVRGDAGLADILRATFPGGSITGAPKIRAMEIIDELEPARRGPYTGAFGCFSHGGGIELAIAIRTAVIAGGELRLHVGGGIVADSTSARELEETEEKAAAWRAALAGLTG